MIYRFFSIHNKRLIICFIDFKKVLKIHAEAHKTLSTSGNTLRQKEQIWEHANTWC